MAKKKKISKKNISVDFVQEVITKKYLYNVTVDGKQYRVENCYQNGVWKGINLWDSEYNEVFDDQLIDELLLNMMELRIMIP